MELVARDYVEFASFAFDCKRGYKPRHDMFVWSSHGRNFTMFDMLLSRDGEGVRFCDWRSASAARFAQVFMRAPVEYDYPPAGWYDTHRAEVAEWRLQHRLRADIAAVAATAAALEEGTTADDVAVDGVVTQSLGTHFALVVLRDIVLRQLRVDLRASHARVPGLGAAEYA